MPALPPLFGQARSDTCTLACLRMVLAHHGIEVTERALEAQVAKQAGGVAIEELAQLAGR